MCQMTTAAADHHTLIVASSHFFRDVDQTCFVSSRHIVSIYIFPSPMMFAVWAPIVRTKKSRCATALSSPAFHVFLNQNLYADTRHIRVPSVISEWTTDEHAKQQTCSARENEISIFV